MRAWKRPDGRYHLDDSDEPRHRRAYHRRREIRERGGRWSDTYGVWFVPEDALEALGAKRVYGVILHLRGPGRPGRGPHHPGPALHPLRQPSWPGGHHRGARGE
jgi:hypothetical protein